MRLEDLLKFAHAIFKQVGAPHAVIGAFGMSSHGFMRATNDIDFLVDGDFRTEVEKAFLQKGFRIFKSNDEVVQLEGPGPIDIIFAKRPLSKAMLTKTLATKILDVPVLDAEDIIGLKIQALATNPKRKFKELGDIQSLSLSKKDLDWNQIKKYADLFAVWDVVNEIKKGSEE